MIMVFWMNHVKQSHSFSGNNGCHPKHQGDCDIRGPWGGPRGGRAGSRCRPACGNPPPAPASHLCTPFFPHPLLRAVRMRNLLIPLPVQGFHLNTTTSLSTSHFLMGSEGLPHRPGAGVGGRSSPWGSTAGEELEQLGLMPCTHGCGLLMPQTFSVYD